MTKKSKMEKSLFDCPIVLPMQFRCPKKREEQEEMVHRDCHKFQKIV